MRVYNYQKPWWMFWRVKLEQDIRRYNDGYCWAAGELLSGDDIEAFEVKAESYYWHGDYGEFDRGADKAIEDFKKLIRYKGAI